MVWGTPSHLGCLPNALGCELSYWTELSGRLANGETQNLFFRLYENKVEEGGD